MTRSVRLATAALVSAASLPCLAQAQATPGTPFQKTLVCTIADGSYQCSTALTVPANTYLTIQTLSAYRYGNVAGGETVFFSPTFKRDMANIVMPPLPAPGGDVAYSSSTIAVQAYAQAGAQNYFYIDRTGSSGVETVSITVSGYTTSTQ